METAPLDANVPGAAQWLKRRKENGRSTVLFLGARAGGLFRSKTLYSICRSFSPRAFDNMTQIQQFEECYRVLCEGDFSRSDIHSILVPSLQSLPVAPADRYLANLFQAGIFTMIISTNIDTLLPKAFAEAGMEVDKDFQIFIPQQYSPDTFVNAAYKQLPTLIKLSGDLETGEHSLFKQNFYLETHDMLKTFLSAILSDSMVMLGYDPFWDRAIDAIFSSQGQEFWYINEERPQATFSTILQNRRGRAIIGGEGSYEPFIQHLHWHLDEEKALDDPLLQKPWETRLYPSLQGFETRSAPSNPAQADQTSGELRSEQAQRTSVFIGYSRKDKRYLTRFKSHLARYERQKLLDVWDDSNVKPGTNYREQLHGALHHAKVVILLVSSDFFASEFINENIVAPLLHIPEEKRAVIFPVIVRSCNFADSDLQQFQPLNPPSRPLSKKSVDQDAVWADLARVLVTMGRDKKE